MELLTWLRIQWDRAAAAAALIAGCLMLVYGWFRVSDTPFVAEQIAYVISAGLGGVFLLGVAGALWVSADLRDEWRKLDDVEAAIRAVAPATPDVTANDLGAEVAALRERLAALEVELRGAPPIVPKTNGRRARPLSPTGTK